MTRSTHSTVKSSHPVPGVHSPILAECVNLAGTLANCLPIVVEDEIQRMFDDLSNRIEAIPPTQVPLATMVYMRNRVRSARTLATAGEMSVAAYELREMSRKLDRMFTTDQKCSAWWGVR